MTSHEKRLLLVLDDVSTEKVKEWKPFKDSLKNVGPGSIIVVTTREDRVAKDVGTHYLYRLDVMSESDCWLLLKQIAFSGRSELCEGVEKIGQEIAKKCNGLPLAIKTIGSLLRLKEDTVLEWREVLESNIWDMGEESIICFPHLFLSYNELSPQLKKCFAYCAVFPKDTEIHVEKLIRLWMAQGFLGNQSQTDPDKLNAKGRGYFMNLAMRSFFQNITRSLFDVNVIVSCKMHGIVHDFAQFLTENERRVFDEPDCERAETNGKRLHLAFIGKIKPINSSDMGRARSFIIINSDIELSSQDLCGRLKLVRSLVLSNCGLRDLPREIGSLIHLRCLDVSKNALKELPETVCDLYFLESLDVSYCHELECLPQRIGDLVHLRYLLNLETENVEQMPQGLEKLTSLWNLGRFVADDTPLNNMGKLEHLNQLEELRIYVCGHVNIESAQLGNKNCLRYLKVHFEVESLTEENTNSIETMKLPPNLQQLIFRDYPRDQLPEWIVRAESLVRHLTVLCISGDNISSLPALGKLSSLQILRLVEMRKLQNIRREFYGLPDHDGFEGVVFKSLRKLSMWSLSIWETWEDTSAAHAEDTSAPHEEDTSAAHENIMPRLETLEIYWCQNLVSLPNWLRWKLSSLKIEFINCRRLRKDTKTIKELSQRLKKDTQTIMEMMGKNLTYPIPSNFLGGNGGWIDDEKRLYLIKGEVAAGAANSRGRKARRKAGRKGGKGDGSTVEQKLAVQQSEFFLSKSAK